MPPGWELDDSAEADAMGLLPLKWVDETPG